MTLFIQGCIDITSMQALAAASPLDPPPTMATFILAPEYPASSVCLQLFTYTHYNRCTLHVDHQHCVRVTARPSPLAPDQLCCIRGATPE